MTQAKPDVVPFPTTGSREPFSTRQRVVVATTLAIALLLVTLGVGFLVNKYFRLSAIDDYRAGYAQGVEWRESGGAKVYNCSSAMESRYGPPAGFAQRIPDGWGEYFAGCQDGMRGEPAAPWYGLRERMTSAVEIEID